MGDVVGLRGEAIVPPGEPDERVISLCEEMLEAARSGTIQAVHASVRFHDNTHSRWCAGSPTLGTIGNLERLKHWLCTDMDERAREELPTG